MTRLWPDWSPVLPACAVLAQSSSRRKRGWNLASLSFMVKATKPPAVHQTQHVTCAAKVPGKFSVRQRPGLRTCS